MVDAIGLSEHWADLEKMVSPTIILKTSPFVEMEKLPLGTSRLGGLPDLPPNVLWPKKDAVWLEFVGQFRLEDLAAYDLENRLPETGMLYFFFDGTLAGYELGEAKDRCAVLYYPLAESNLIRLEPPADRPGGFDIYKPCLIRFENILTLPPSEEVYSGFFPTLWPTALSWENIHLYNQLREQLMEHATWFIGHPWELQGGELRYQVVKKRDTAGRYKYENYNFTHEDELIAEMKQWRLLMQVGSDLHTEMTWGDGGIVYFWIREEDFTARKFDQVEALMQCG